MKEYDELVCRNVLTKSCKKPVEARSRRSFIQLRRRLEIVERFDASMSTNFSEDKNTIQTRTKQICFQGDMTIVKTNSCVLANELLHNVIRVIRVDVGEVISPQE